MQLDTPVEPQHGELDVETQAETRIEAQLFVKILHVEDRIIGVLRRSPFQKPNIAHVEKRRTVDNAPNREAEFEVGLQFHVAQLRRKIRFGARHRTRAERTGCPAAHTVAAPRIEQTVERHRSRIAVGHRQTAVEPSSQSRFRAQHDFAAHAHVEPEILRITNTQYLVVAFVRRPHGRCEPMRQPADQVARRLGIEPDDRRIAAEVFQLVIVTVAERQTGYQLRLVTVDEVEIFRIAQKIGIQIAHVDHVNIDRPQ